MKLTYSLTTLTRKYPFRISQHTFTDSTVIYTRIEHEGFTGHGEACPGYYFDETIETAQAFLDRLNLEQFNDPSAISEILAYADDVAAGYTAAKASVDIALHDLVGKMSDKPCYALFGVDPHAMPSTSLTIGMDRPAMIRKKVKEASEFKVIKVKLGGDNDKNIVEAIRSETDKPMFVDANQGWTDREQALDMIHWLNERNTLLIEQPMDKNDWKNNAWLTENSPLPTVGDEAVQRLGDVKKAKGVYSGINIKMVKCTGMNEGFKMIQKARALGLNVMIGCMGESPVAILGAAAIAPLCDWVDLDSPWLFTPTPYRLPRLEGGKIILSRRPGLGLIKNNHSA